MTQITKELIIEDWLKGLSRDRIAEKHGPSTGTVTNVIREWTAGLEEGVPEELREFALALRKLKITAPRSAIGARVAYMMSQIGLDEDSFYSFMSQTYDQYKKLGLHPERLSNDVKLLTELSQRIPWDEIPAHIEGQVARNQKLEQEIQKMESVSSQARARLDRALEDEAMTKKEIDEYRLFRAGMNKNRILMANVPAFVKTINEIRQLGYDPTSIVSKVSDFQKLQLVEKELKDSVELSRKKKDELERKYGFLESEIDVHSQTLSKFKELEDMGFGLKEQKLLWHKVREIGIANHMNPDAAVQKFMMDVEEQYDDMLGFEPKIVKSKSELQNNATMIQNLSSKIAIQIQNNEQVKQLMSSILEKQIEQLTRVSEFSALTQAAKGEPVDPNDLKFSLRKAIETVLGRLDAKDSITKVLETTKLELGKTGDIWT